MKELIVNGTCTSSSLDLSRPLNRRALLQASPHSVVSHKPRQVFERRVMREASRMMWCGTLKELDGTPCMFQERNGVTSCVPFEGGGGAMGQEIDCINYTEYGVCNVDLHREPFNLHRLGYAQAT
jgi:hypothetical protein